VSTDIIAERTLLTNEVPAREVRVRVARPTLNSEYQEYECAYYINGPGIARSNVSRGLDGIQALQGAFVMIGREVAYLEAQNDFTLTFSDLGDAGFPRP
jgi:hypothetical protein